MFGRIGLFLGLGLAMLAPVKADAQTLQTLLVFSGGQANDPYKATRGALPVGGLISHGNYLYGTTSSGGNGGCGFSSNCGTVFRINPATGKLGTLYKFCSQPGCTDGGHPLGGLVFKSGAFYGTTEVGGNGNGVVFKLAQVNGSWTETVLHTFCSSGNCADGNYPSSTLVIDKSGVLYGTTAGGPGVGTYGTVFKLDPATSTLTTLYTFTGQGDGSTPVGGVVFGKGGALYGTTEYGGISSGTCGSSQSNGTVFRLDPTTGKLTTILAFPTENQNPCWPFGKNPTAALTVGAQGALFGTTTLGGANGYGTAFELTPAQGGVWNETVLHSFCTPPDCTDSAVPTGQMVLDKTGMLYGTASYYGAAYTEGSVFALNPATQSLTTLYSFTGYLSGCPPQCTTLYPNGSYPAAGPTIVYQPDGSFVLYGTTQWGGGNPNNGCESGVDSCGTVFKLTP